MNLFYQPDALTGANHLNAEESRHCVRVLRKKIGDTIHITDGAGTVFLAGILHASPAKCTFEIKERKAQPKEGGGIHIAISPTKNPDRMEWFVEKAVEIGVESITFLISARSERIRIKRDRLVKISVSAMKQSLRAWLPTVNEPAPFAEVVSGTFSGLKFLALDSSAPPLSFLTRHSQSQLIIVGPEGGFTEEEAALARAHQFAFVSLGQHRLRTETAGLVACSILNHSAPGN